MAPLKAPARRHDHYNTESLPSRVAVDLTSALAASTLVAPIITVIDQSIIRRTHNPAPLREHILTAARDALKRPVRFVTSAPYLLITSLYLMTYLTANLTDTLSSTVYNERADKVYAGTSKFAATSAANMAMCLYKDAQFAKLFGASSAKPAPARPSPSFSASIPSQIRLYSTAAASAIQQSGPHAAASAMHAPRVPRVSLALFAIRDSMTVFASFNVPPVLGPMIGSQSAAQFIAPAIVQFASTPLHLLGLDLYNRPTGCGGSTCNGGITRACRWECVRRDWFGAALARIGRIVPAFGVGGVVNASVRRNMMGSLES